MATTLELLRWGLDPAAMFRATGREPDPWQVDFLRSDAPRVLMLAHRQAGKSSVVSIKALHKAVFEPGSLVLIASPTQNQSNELFRKRGEAYETLGRPPRATRRPPSRWGCPTAPGW